jgi:hypothetical protein
MKHGLVAILVAAGSVGTAPRARADVERYAVLIGDNRGGADEAALHFAERDVVRVRDALENVGGFANDHVIVLADVEAASVRRTLLEVNDRIRARTDDGHPTMLVVYYSGHGDALSLHLRDTRFDLAELQHLISGSAATFRLLITDACRSGGLTRVKGGSSSPPIAIRIGEQLAGEGAVFLTSSAASEASQESDALGGSFFTHYLVSGLLGAADADGDGRVSLVEAYRYAYDHTLGASSETIDGLQHPTFEYQVRGKGDLVLTTPGAQRRDRGAVTFPAGYTFLVFAGDRDGAVIAEIGKYDTVRRLSLAHGRYFVRGRGQRELIEGPLDVAAGEERALDDGRLDHVAYARLVRKGGAEIEIAHGPEAGAWLGTPAIDGLSPCAGGFAGYVVELPRGSLVPRLGGCHARRTGTYLTDSLDQIELDIAATHTWDAGRLALALGVSAGGALLVRTFQTTGTAPPRTSFAPQVGAIVGASWALPRGFFVATDVTAGTAFVREQSDSGTAVIAARFQLRGVLAIGKHLR